MFKSLSKYSDKELQELVKSNNKRNLAFEQIFDRYSNFAIGFIRNLVKNESLAQELFQETFIRLYNQILDKEEVNIPGMITTISRNLFFNYKRNGKQELQLDEIEIGEDEVDIIGNKELLDLVLNSVEFLDEKYRNVFILRELNGLSFREIADLENISFANAKLRNTRAKQKIMHILKPYINDLEKNLK